MADLITESKSSKFVLYDEMFEVESLFQQLKDSNFTLKSKGLSAQSSI